jgi:cell division protein FtsL
LEYSDKHDILSEIDSVIGAQNELSFDYLLAVFMGMTLILLLAFPKVFLHSSIYYKSRDISSLEREYKSLKEENKIISNEVERKKFKNQILDTLF